MSKICAIFGIYDFELAPYALGDILTWNVQTSIQCIEASRSHVDIYICLDSRYPSSVYQRGLVTSENNYLFFNELLGAYGTHPMLGSIFIFTDRDQLVERLKEVAVGDLINSSILNDYLVALKKRDNLDALSNYFHKYIYSHERINAFSVSHGHVPQLVASRGCVPDVRGVMKHVLGGKRAIFIHPRLRRLDVGYGGHHTYSRDSDFLEWYDFVRRTGTKHPDVQFVVVGRLQEKPLELLRLDNVTSLRSFGLGLGHELTLLREADLFIGTSSGFAAMANFCAVPYFVTHMNKESCKAYAIPEGQNTLPFAAENQELVYGKETSELLMELLERGLVLPPRGSQEAVVERTEEIDVPAFERERRSYLESAASTSRFFEDDRYADLETALLIQPRIHAHFEEVCFGRRANVRRFVQKVRLNFPRLEGCFPEFDTLAAARRPGPQKWLAIRIRARLLRVSGDVMPTWMHGTFVHRMLRFMKDRIVGFERR